MEKHLHRYSAHCARRNQDVICPAPDLILSQRAMEHAVRLSRVMVMLQDSNVNRHSTHVCTLSDHTRMPRPPSGGERQWKKEPNKIRSLHNGSTGKWGIIMCV